MNAFLSGLQFSNEAQGITDSNFRGVGDGGLPRANMDYNMTDNLNFINLQSRIYDMHNIMRQLGNLEGEQGNDAQGNTLGPKGGFPMASPYNAVGSSSITKTTLGTGFNPAGRTGNSLLAFNNEGGHQLND